MIKKVVKRVGQKLVKSSLKKFGSENETYTTKGKSRVTPPTIKGVNKSLIKTIKSAPGYKKTIQGKKRKGFDRILGG